MPLAAAQRLPRRAGPALHDDGALRGDLVGILDVRDDRAPVAADGGRHLEDGFRGGESGSRRFRWPSRRATARRGSRPPRRSWRWTGRSGQAASAGRSKDGFTERQQARAVQDLRGSATSCPTNENSSDGAAARDQRGVMLATGADVFCPSPGAADARQGSRQVRCGGSPGTRRCEPPAARPGTRAPGGSGSAARSAPASAWDRGRRSCGRCGRPGRARPSRRRRS